MLLLLRVDSRGLGRARGHEVPRRVVGIRRDRATQRRRTCDVNRSTLKLSTAIYNCPSLHGIPFFPQLVVLLRVLPLEHMAQRGQLYVSSRPAIHNDQPTIADESSPLLPPAAPDVLESQSLSLPAKIQSVPTPLPKAQLICLCVIRLVDPIAFTQIFPYINEMMAHLHLTNDPLRVGFYSGLAESAFSISSLFSIYQWARLSGAIVCCYLIFDLLHHWFFIKT